jgi:hypothetical protein
VQATRHLPFVQGTAEGRHGPAPRPRHGHRPCAGQHGRRSCGALSRPRSARATHMEFTIDPAADGVLLSSDRVRAPRTVPSRRGWVGRVEAGQGPSRPNGGAGPLPLDSGLAARVEGWSTLARCGVGIHITAPTSHTGFRGTITLEITNHGTLPMRENSGAHSRARTPSPAKSAAVAYEGICGSN